MTDKVIINNATDVLIVVDVQNDFLTGTLAIPDGESILLNVGYYIKLFLRKVFSQDYHPADHSSFAVNGGIWPIHCVQDTEGVKIHASIPISEYHSVIVRKAREKDKDAYSAFDGTDLVNLLKDINIERLFICGLATDYCVKFTAIDARKHFGKVYVLLDAIQAVNVNPHDGDKAIDEMVAAGVICITKEFLTSQYTE